jgi:hypothetical protein
VFKTLMGQMLPTGLLGGFLVMAAASVVAQVPTWIAQYLQVRVLTQVASGNYGVLTEAWFANILKILSSLLLTVVFAARLGLARPMRMIVLAGPQSVSGTGDVLRLALGRFGPNLVASVVYFFIVAMGTMFCFLPGIAAAVLLYPALYMVATERDLGASLSSSMDWVSRHTGALLGTAGVLFAIGVVMFCCSCGSLGVMTTRLGPTTSVYTLPFMTVFGELVSVVSLTFLTSGCIAADQVESAPPSAQAPRGPF